jgi:peptide/nickel transport system substrate-binding protein
MRAWGSALLAVLLLASGAALLTACSGDGGENNDKNEITIGYFAQPDSLDPALGFTMPSGAALYQVYLPLLTYKRVEGAGGTRLIPGLAERPPEVDSAQTTYSLRLREGLVYADGSRVKASDFEHAIKRVLKLGSPGAPFYERIVGARAYEARGKSGADIEGIETDNRTRRIVIRLERPYAAFDHLLALPFAAPVPANTPFDDTTKQPPPGTGPLQIAKSEPNREFVLARNPKFESLGIDEVPPAKVDRITVKVGLDKSKQAEDVLAGKLDYMLDSPPSDLLPTIIERAHDRYETHVLLNTNWFFLNERLPPFDDPRVRQAVNYAVDKRALERVYAGGLRAGCSFLPDGIPGYDEELDTSGCPFGDPDKPAALARAKQLIRAAGAEGEKVTVWGFSETPSSDVVQSYTEVLNQIGLEAEPRLVDFAIWRQAIGNAKNRPQTGAEGSGQTFPHPLAFFGLLDGKIIRATSNKNTSNVDDPHVNGALRRLERERDPDAAAGDAAELNRYVVEHGYLVPYGHRIRGTFVSERMDFENCTFFHLVYLEDFSQFCLKEGE